MKVGAPIIWVVLFDSVAPPKEYEPVVPYLPTTPFMHLFDPEMVPALQPLWWSLHLPNDYAQCYDVDAWKLVATEELDIPHAILLVPLGFLRSHGDKFVAPPNIALIVSPDSSLSEAQQYAERWGSAFGIVPYSDLTQETLDKYWRSVATVAGERAVRALAPPLIQLSAGSAERLSLIFRLRQFDSPTERSDNHVDCSQSELIKRALWASLHTRTIASLERSGCRPDEFDERYDAEVKNTRPSWHLAIGAFGAPAMVRKLAASKENAPPLGLASATIEDEQRVLELLVAHRAIARGGFGMRLPDVPERAFSALRDLEQAVRSVRGNRRTAKTALERIGKILGQALTTEQCLAIRSSRTVTAFTDFPWGLAVLPGDTSPLTTCVPITYRPLTPLARALQFELTPPAALYLGDGFSVLIVECLEKTDSIRAVSERGWRNEAQRLVKRGGGKIKCRFEIAECLADLHRLLDESSYDFLILSAHGVSNGRLAGLQIGKDKVYDFGHRLPPVVMISACEVWPRGRGAISVADLALRRGALTVLGTLVPIDVNHNQFVMTRTLLYITESLHRREKHMTFADAVAWALASNAIIDVLHASQRLKLWGFRPGADGQEPPVVEFMNRRSIGRLRAGHIYEDTEQLLLEIAEEHGPEHLKGVRDLLRSTGYVPESLFYVMIGWPEKVVLRPRVVGEDAIWRAAAEDQAPPNPEDKR